MTSLKEEGLLGWPFASGFVGACARCDCFHFLRRHPSLIIYHRVMTWLVFRLRHTLRSASAMPVPPGPGKAGGHPRVVPPGRVADGGGLSSSSDGARGSHGSSAPSKVSTVSSAKGPKSSCKVPPGGVLV